MISNACKFVDNIKSEKCCNRSIDNESIDKAFVNDDLGHTYPDEVINTDNLYSETHQCNVFMTSMYNNSV